MMIFNTLQQAQDFIQNFELIKNNIEQPIEVLERLKACEQIAKEHHEYKLLSKSRIFLTNYYIQTNDLENALTIGLQNKKLTEDENLEEEQLNCYSGLLNIYHMLGDYSSLEELISIYRDKLINTNNLNKLCSLYIISAIQYYTLKEFKKCIDANEKALEYAKKINNTELLIHVYNNYGFHVLKYDVDLSYDLLSKCVELIKNSDKSKYAQNLAVVNINLANLFFIKNDYETCTKYLDEAISISKAINIKNILLEAENKLCELYIKTQKFDLAKQLLLKNELYCVETNNKYLLLNIYNSLQQLHKETDEYKHAYEYLLKYQDIQNDIFNEEAIQKIKNLQITNEVKEIKQQRDHAEKLARLKHDFLANMSHEIRTPINSVLGICYLIQQDNLTPKQFEYIKRLERSSESLLCLINDILDLSKVEAGKLELVTVPFVYNNLLKDIINSLQYKANEKNIDIILNTNKDLDKLIIGDVQRLNQIIINILANAIKFTNNGYVKITSSVTQLTDTDLIVTCVIEDTGIGISEDKINLIFERYEQASATIKTTFGGTGLGLSISKKLIELMNGQVLVESQLDKGTTFTINIPFKYQDIQLHESQKSEEYDTSFLNHLDIILADDTAESRLVTKEILLHFNPTLQIREAENGIEVLNLLESKTTDLILMDLDMPILNGFDAVEKIRAHYPKLTFKIIAHTASLLTLTVEELLEMGFDDLITKPFKATELLQKISIIKNKKAEI